MDLNDYRRKKRWSQAELARRLDVSVRAVQSWEQGLRSPDRRSKKSIVKLLEFEKQKEEILKAFRKPS